MWKQPCQTPLDSEATTHRQPQGNVDPDEMRGLFFDHGISYRVDLPAPIPRELEFIRNREGRMKLWRDVTKNLAKQYDHYMPAAFTSLIKKSKMFKVDEEDVHNRSFDIGLIFSRSIDRPLIPILKSPIEVVCRIRRHRYDRRRQNSLQARLTQY